MECIILQHPLVFAIEMTINLFFIQGTYEDF